jgi:hypothetical protein
VRQRVARPFVTVEVKRNRLGLSQALSTTEPKQRKNSIVKAKPALSREAATPDARWSNLIAGGPGEASTSAATMTVPAPTQDAAGQGPVRRILPSILSTAVAADRLRLEDETPSPRRRRIRSDTVKTGGSPEGPEIKVQPDDARMSRPETLAAGSPSPAVGPRVGRPIPSRVAVATSPVTPPRWSGAEAVKQDRMRAGDIRVLRGARRWAERRGEAMMLRPGERWKRRLPPVCW